jgi:uncharacterized membrane protein
VSPRRDDEGTVLVLVLGFTMVLALLVGVVVNVSAAVLARRSVSGAADGAAVAAAQALDVEALYRAGLPGERLPLSQADAQRRVAAYGAQVAPDQPGLRLTVTVDGSTASVLAVREVRLPFGRLLGLRPLRVEATARARAPVAP